MTMGTMGVIFLFVIASLFTFILLIVFAAYGRLWFQAYMSGADISFISLVGMGFRSQSIKAKTKH